MGPPLVDDHVLRPAFNMGIAFAEESEKKPEGQRKKPRKTGGMPLHLPSPVEEIKPSLLEEEEDWPIDTSSRRVVLHCIRK